MPGSRSLSAVLPPARDLTGRLRTAGLFLLVSIGLWGLVRLSGLDTPAGAAWFPPAGLEFGYLALVGSRGIPLVLVARVLGQAVVFPAVLAADPGRMLAADVIAVGVLAGAATLLRRSWRPQAPVASLAWFVLTGLVLAPVGVLLGDALLAAVTGGELSAVAGRRLLESAVGQMTAIATIGPAVVQLVAAPRTDGRLGGGRRGRVEAFAQALAVVLVPVAVALALVARPAELPLLLTALLPLVWVALRPDLRRATAGIAVAGLVIGFAAQRLLASPDAGLRVQVALLGCAVAALAVTATLDAAARGRRAARLRELRWTALLEASPVSVARVTRDGRWVPDTGSGERDRLLAHLATVPGIAQAVAHRSRSTVHWTMGGQSSITSPPGLIPALRLPVAQRPTTSDEAQTRDSRPGNRPVATEPVEPRALRSTGDRAGRSFETRVSPMPDGELLLITTETTRTMSAETALAWERTHDPDTGLPNRELLFAAAERAGADGVPASLVVVDVERLSRLSQLVGGDLSTAAVRVARRIELVLAERSGPDADAVVARVGDDRFAVLVQGGLGAALEAGRLIVDALRRPLGGAGESLHVRARVGVAELEPGHDPRKSLRRASIAAQAAEEHGIDDVLVLDPLTASTTTQRVRLAGRVVDAADRDELDLFFQPDVRLPDGRLLGVEALVRWRPREGQTTATELFVHLAEETGTVAAVDRWMMEHALAEVGSWRRRSPAVDMEVALNLSPASLTTDLPDRIAEACARHGVPPHRLRLEITENMLDDDNRARKVLWEARELGCRVALDDFGTGHATLSRLRRLPVDVIKLDRSFLHSVSDDRGSRALVELMVGLAGPLDLEVMAEGVETAAQRDTLIDLGCRRAQGYLFARPSPAPAVLRMMDAQFA
jgi:EAL domain-containing protein (putative c-di-GMP-specific phosphodiesterase class I)/GGDEF domain-containing protein